MAQTCRREKTYHHSDPPSDVSRDGADSGGSGRTTVIGSVGPQQLLSSVILMLGLVLVGYGGYVYVQESTALSDAVEVEAQITETEIVRASAMRGDTVYVPTATFEYRFGGTDYTSANLFPAGSTKRYKDRADAASVLSDLAVGDTVTAYVVPSAPGEAFLRDSRPDTSGRFLIFGAFVGLVGGLRLVQTWLAARDQSALL